MRTHTHTHTTKPSSGLKLLGFVGSSPKHSAPTGIYPSPPPDYGWHDLSRLSSRTGIRIGDENTASKRKKRKKKKRKEEKKKVKETKDFKKGRRKKRRKKKEEPRYSPTQSRLW